MEINGLKEIVDDALKEGTFSLATEKLGSAAAKRVSDDFLPDNKLRLNGATIGQPEQSGEIIVRGTGVDLPFKGMTVKLRLYIEGDDAAFELTATGDANWTL